MKRILGMILIAVSLPAVAEVGVSVNIGEPGFYGHIEIGDFPQPRVIYREPRIVERTPVLVREPIYLHVPPGHAKHWSKHCREYDACGRPVYFVDDRWYNEVYVPRYREKHGGGRHDDDDRGRHGRGHDGKHQD